MEDTLGTKIRAAIRSGKLDEELDYIADTIRTRRRVLKEALAEEHRSEIHVGDTVVFLNGISPTYLEGITAEVQSTNSRGSLVVQIEPGVRRFGGSVVKLTPRLMHLVKKAEV